MLNVKNCPEPTQNERLNDANRSKAFSNAGYGPVDPDYSNDMFWMDKADRWGLPPAIAYLRRCGKCSVYDISEKMIACGGATEDGEVGYCHLHKFKCSAFRTCNGWAAGGPMI